MSKVFPDRTFDCQLEDMAFKLRVLSGESGERVDEIVKQLSNPATATKELRDELYGMCIVSWPWDGTLRSVLNDNECWRLVGACLEGSKLTAEERKKFVSQSWCSEKKSATTDQPAS